LTSTYLKTSSILGRREYVHAWLVRACGCTSCMWHRLTSCPSKRCLCCGHRARPLGVAEATYRSTWSLPRVHSRCAPPSSSPCTLRSHVTGSASGTASNLLQARQPRMCTTVAGRSISPCGTASPLGSSTASCISRHEHDSHGNTRPVHMHM
jgi:hypothetical protein